MTKPTTWDVVNDTVRPVTSSAPATRTQAPEAGSNGPEAAGSWAGWRSVRSATTPATPAATAPAPAPATVRKQPRWKLALDSVMTMDDRVMTSLARPRTYALLLAGFAAFALAIAGVGLFGVLSYSVAQRTREIGVRTALGAQARDIVRMIFRQGLGITALGVVTGLLVSAASARSLSTFLFGVTAFDATSFLVVPVVLAVVAVAACLVPARRAARVDPLQALRAN